MLTIRFFGGPAHMDTREYDDPPSAISVVVSATEERAQLDKQLLEMLGIPPPVGTFVAHYVLMAEWMDERLYIFIGHEGEIPDGETDG